MSVQSCRHIKEDGVFCQSPALRGREYCYSHLRVLGRRMRMASEAARQEPHRLLLPVLDNLPAVHAGLMQVLDALAAGHIEERRAGLLLYGLQQASANLRATASQPALALEDPAERAEEYPGFEAEFSLPPDVDPSTPSQEVSPATPEPSKVEPSPYRESIYFRMQEIAPEDVELEELERTRGRKASERRRSQLQRQVAKEWEKSRRAVERARYVVEADRRNREALLWMPEQEPAMHLRNSAAAEQKRAGEEEAALSFREPGGPEATLQRPKKSPASVSKKIAEVEGSTGS